MCLLASGSQPSPAGRAALVEWFGDRTTGPEPLSGIPTERLPVGRGCLLFYRDAAMARHMDEVAYLPMADGEGPFSVITRVRRGVEFEMSGLDELLAADHDPGGVRPPEPYQAWLCAQLVIEVAAVTPGDPGSHPFSSWVLAEVKRACIGYIEPRAEPDLGT